MKKTVLLCLLACSSLIATAQYTIYDSATRYNISPSFYTAMDTLIAHAATTLADTGESEAYILTREKYFLGSRISLDVPPGADMIAPMGEALNSYMTYFADYCPGSGFTGNWSCLGPFTNYYGANVEQQQGRILSLWVNPLDSNTILAGADGGGLWKSGNDGHSWHNLTDGNGSNSVIGIPSVYGIAVNPLDTNTIYISLSADPSTKNNGYSLGLAYSTDGGNTWQSDTAFAALTDIFSSTAKIGYIPGTQKLLAISNTNVLYKANPDTSWQNITPTAFTSGSRWCFDLGFTNDPAGRAVVTFGALYDTSYLGVYDSVSGWSLVPMGLSGYTQEDYHDGAVAFSMSSADTAYMYFRANSGGAPLFLKTPITSFIPTILNTSFPCNIQQFAVSQGNSHVIYGANYSSSCVGGTFTQSTTECNNAGGVFPEISSGDHTDGRCLYIWRTYNDPDSDVVYFGCDGGVSKKRMGQTHTQSITGDSLAITQFYGFGNTDADENIMAGGTQDDGTFAYIKSRTAPWGNGNVYGGDGYTAKIMKNGINLAFGELNSSSSPYPMFGVSFSDTTTGLFSISTPTDSVTTSINRPIYFSPDNTAYVGYTHIWKFPYGSTSSYTGAWQRAFAADPIDQGSFAFTKIVADFYIDENDGNNAYVVYESAAAGNPSVDTFAKLYFSNNAQASSPSPSWTNITPSIVSTNNINSIAVDPDNFGRIWIAFGNINNNYVGATPDTMKDRVWYSADTGRTWSDVSAGLSALPVNKLLYRYGSNDEIFAGTDVGVFVWNTATSSWQCYNNGLPPCIVTDMEFNYCAGKLRISTFGRGIWESLLDTITPAPIASTTITTATTWNENQWLQTSVDVQSGGTLTLTGDTIHMPKNGVITVEAGGHLIVNHAVITNSCSQCFWQGIIAAGASNEIEQSPAADGWVTIKNNSTISNALMAVSNYNSPDSLSGSGGILQCSNSRLINNKNCVTLTNYVDTTTLGAPRGNLSYFYNCDFDLDNNYKGDALGDTAGYFVNLEGIMNVVFEGCRWLNRDRALPDSLRGYGIFAANASFAVTGYCPGVSTGYTCMADIIPSRFSGFTNGITIMGALGADLAISIANTRFDSSGVGVVVSMQKNVSVICDTFNTGWGVGVDDISGGCIENIGCFFQNTDQFRLEGNVFTGFPSGAASTAPSWKNYGAIVANSDLRPIGSSLSYPSTPNNIYRNSFSDLTIGAYALSANYGLQVLCNTFYDNTTDIREDSVSGSSYWQGMLTCGYYTQPAANTFSGSTYNVIDNTGHPLSYGYSLPDRATECPFITSPNVDTFSTTASDVCTPTFGSPGIGAHPYASMRLDRSVLNAYEASFLAAQIPFV